MKVPGFFVRVCKIASSWRPTRRFGAKAGRNETPIPAVYFRRLGLDKEDVRAGAALMFLFVFTASSILLFYLIGYLSLLVGLVFGYAAFTWFINKIPKALEKEKVTISYHVPIILQEIVLASAGTGSIFDLITLVVKGKHPFVSKAFSRIAKHVGNGYDPERLVRRYANIQPCETLRRYLLDAVALNLEWTELKKLLKERKGEAEFEFQKYTMQLETRVLLIVGLGTFWPIIFSIGVLVNGSWHNQPSMILFALLFIVFLVILENQLMKPIRRIEILGGQTGFTRAKRLLRHTAKEELQEVTVVLSLLGETLTRDRTSPEFATRKVSETYNGWLSPLLIEVVRKIMYDGKTFDDAWFWFRSKFSSIQCRQIIGIIPQMVEKTAEESGERLLEILSHIKENQALIEERENILKAQRFKAKLLSLFSPAALGLIGAISPLFAMVGTREPAFYWFRPSILTADAFLTTVVLLLMTMVNTFSIMKTVGAERPALYVCASASIFVSVFAFSIRLLNALI